MTSLPAFRHLSDDDKAAVVFFLRTIEGEGFGYTIENYPPNFPAGSPLTDADLRQVQDAYEMAYVGLSNNDPDQWWRLYEKGERAR